jgi:hypothetical protein
MRLGVGVGGIWGVGKPTDAANDEIAEDNEVGVTGFTVPVEFALGGTPAPGLVIGGGSYAVHVPSANYTTGRGDFVLEEGADYGSITMVGPFIDGYPVPTGGFHLLVAPCFAAVAPGSSDVIVDDDLAGVGWGIVLGLGYEAWIGEQWSAGWLLRAQYVSVELEPESGSGNTDFIALVPSGLFSVTLH